MPDDSGDPTNPPTPPPADGTEPRVIGTKDGSPYVLGRPPIDGTDEEIDAWARRFVGVMIAGLKAADPRD